MRITLVVHGFPPYERTGVENYTEALARALGGRGHTVEVFAPRSAPDLPEHSLRREERGDYAVTWITINEDPDGPRTMLERPGVARSFAGFLDSERPQIVHFQHVVKLGLGLIFEAAERGIPTVYTAHDYYAVCHRYTLLRPDLSHCEVRGDFMACALCDVALGYLNELDGLGDYQMGVLPEQLTPDQRAGLAGILEDDPEPAGLELARLDAATDLRRELDSMRLQAFSRLDLVLAPTRFLARELTRGGVAPERIEVLPYGVETRDLQDLKAVGPVAQGSSKEGGLRFAFLGGLAKHKGVHILLDAFGRLGQSEDGRRPAELTIWGHGTDAPYVALLKKRAREVGARWGGPYRRPQLPDILAAVDVVVVPSIWVENQPLVIREAFAAGRPVLTSDFGAMPESVQHGVDGLLFAVNDPQALASAMQRCIAEEGLVTQLARGIGPVHDTREQVLELESIYARLGAASESSEREIEPESVQPFGDRVRALGQLPTRELFKRVMQGLGELRESLGLGAGIVEQELKKMLQGDPRARVDLRDSRREADWLRTELNDPDRDRELQWLRESLSNKEQELQARIEEVRWLRSEVEARDKHLAWLEEKHDELARDLSEIEKLECSIREEPHDSGHLDALEARFLTLRQHIENVGGQAAHVSSIVHHILGAQAMLASAELEPLLEGLHQLTGLPLPQDSEDPADALLSRVRGAGTIGGQLLDELGWRRQLMAQAQRKAKRRLVGALLSRTGLGREVQSWPNPPQ